jgi:hypothetical protein
MKNIFELTKREQRLVIAIVFTLVMIAFAKNWTERKSNAPRTSTSVQQQRTSTTPSLDLNEKAESPSPPSSP